MEGSKAIFNELEKIEHKCSYVIGLFGNTVPGEQVWMGSLVAQKVETPKIVSNLLERNL